jgi:hypothetical protein
VRAQPAVSVSYEAISRRSATARLSKTLVDALGSLSGVEVYRGSDGVAAGISLHGKDPSLTSYRFNGQQISNPLMSRALDPDIVQAAQVDQGSDIVNFNLLQPTATPTYGATTTYGGFGFSKIDLSVQGRAGAIGYAAQHINRDLLSALNGSTYLDTSGTSYRHDGTYHNYTDLVNVSSALGTAWNASLVAMRGRRTDQVIPAYYTGQLPFGGGGGNVETGEARNAILTLTGTYPKALLAVALSGGTSDVAHVDPSRSFGGSVLPLSDSSLASAASLSVSASLTDRHSTTIFLTHAIGASSSRSLADTDATVIAQQRYAAHVSSLELGQEYMLSKRFKLKPFVGVQHGSGSGFLPTARVSGTVKTSDRDIVTFMASHEGNPANSNYVPGSLADPHTATYDCATGTALIGTPNQRPNDVHASRVQAGWTHTTPRDSISAAVYDERYTGVTLTQASVAALNDTSTVLPPSYLATVVAGYGSIGRCSQPLALDRVFLVHDVSGLALHYRGVNVALSHTFGPSLTMQLRYDLQSSVLARAGSGLGGTSSPYIEGAQIPGEPLQRIGLTASYAFRDGKTEMVANGQYVSANNANRLPAYAIVSAAIERKLSSAASLDIVATNVGHRYVGLFSSNRYAVPLSTGAGPPLLLNAAPLSQPDIFVRLNVKMAHASTF